MSGVVAWVRAHRTWSAVLAVLAVVVALGSVGGSPQKAKPTSASSTPEPTWSPETFDAEPTAQAIPETTAEPVQTAPAPVPTATRPPAPRVVAAALLFAAPGGDGDSWKDTHGREYRMGLVNTPEHDECFGPEATAKRKQLVAHGFRARVYATDRYGRAVSVISLPDGTNLNVWMARHGYANDKYLAQFRSENPALAAQLDAAFAAARGERAGLWGACAAGTPSSPAAATTTTGGGCHPDYVTCIPVKGDGSGNGDANDLDCGDLRRLVQLRQVGVDPYRLDNDGDGYGCDSYA